MIKIKHTGGTFEEALPVLVAIGFIGLALLILSLIFEWDIHKPFIWMIVLGFGSILLNMLFLM